MRVIGDAPPQTRPGESLGQEDRSLKIGYGYIISMMVNEEESYYHAVVGPEVTRVGLSESAILPLMETPEFLSATYGPPEDLVGRRVRIEYVGTRWQSGTAKIVPERTARPIGNLVDIPGRGFRYAVPGGGSI